MKTNQKYCVFFFLHVALLIVSSGCGDSSSPSQPHKPKSDKTDKSRQSFTYEIRCPNSYPKKVDCTDKARALCYGQYERAESPDERIFSNHTPVSSKDDVETNGIHYRSIANEELKKRGLPPVHPEKVRWRTAECAFIAEKVRIAIAHQDDDNVKNLLWKLVLEGDSAASNEFTFGKRPGDLCNFAGRGTDRNQNKIPHFVDGYGPSNWGLIWDTLSEKALRKISEAKFVLKGDKFWGDMATRLKNTGNKILAYHENNQPWGVGVNPNNPQLQKLGLGAGEGMNKQGRILMDVRDPLVIKVATGNADIKGSWKMNWHELEGGPKVPEKQKAIAAHAFYPSEFNDEFSLNKNSVDIKLSAPGQVEISLNREINSVTKAGVECKISKVN